MSLEDFSIDISNSIDPRKTSHIIAPPHTQLSLPPVLPLPGGLPQELRITHPSVHLIPKSLQALLTLSPKYLICQFSPQPIPTVTALLPANLSPGCVRSLLTGFTVSIPATHLPHHQKAIVLYI